MNDIQLQQLLEAIIQPKTIVSLEHYNSLIAEIDRLKKRYETGEKELLQKIAGYYVSQCSKESVISFNNIRKEIEDKGFELRLVVDKGLHLIQKK